MRETTKASGRTTRVTVTLTGSVIAVCAFTFSFGNIWDLALVWGVPAPIAPLVAPMLDISVVGLMIAIRQLALQGIRPRDLIAARLLMLVCAAATWGLNVARALAGHRAGAVIIDSVAPALLLGWAEVGPTLLRLSTQKTTEAVSFDSAGPVRPERSNISAKAAALSRPPVPTIDLGPQALAEPSEVVEDEQRWPHVA